MSNIVEVAAQIDINYARLILNNCLGYPVYRFMSCPIGISTMRWPLVSVSMTISLMLCRIQVYVIFDSGQGRLSR